MSSTNRGGRRSAADNYPTPAWCVHRLLEGVNLPGGTWLDPCAGEGAIIRAVNELRHDVDWRAVELRRSCKRPLERLVGKANVRIGDFLVTNLEGGKADVSITNTPFSLSLEIIERCFQFANIVIVLEKLNFLGSRERHEFLSSNMPDVYVIPNRPSFTNDRKTDSINYGWFVWRSRKRRSSGKLKFLSDTPHEIRNR